MNTPAHQRDARLTVERWRNFYWVPADHPSPEELRLRLDSLVTGEVANSCRRWLKPLLDDADPSVWLIREIQIDLAVDASPDAAPLVAQAWGERMASEIRNTMSRGEENGALLRFPDRVTYVAQWAKDLVSGQAWGKWYYQEFDSLRSLPAGAAIAEAVTREPQLTPRILALLAAQNGQEPILGALRKSDAEKIYRGCFSGTAVDPRDERLWTDRLLQLWSEVAFGVTGAADNRSRDALRLLMTTLVRWRDGDPGLALRSAIDGLLELRHILSSLAQPESVRSFLRAVSLGEREAAAGFAWLDRIEVSNAAIDFAKRVSGGAANWAEQAATVLAPVASLDRKVGECFLTEMGGIFLLGPSFAELKIDAAVHAAAQGCAEPEKAVPLLRHLLAVRSIGRARALASFEDVGLRTFAGFDTRPSFAEMTDALNAARVDAALRIIDESLPDEEKLNLTGGAEKNTSLEYFALVDLTPELKIDPAHDRGWSLIAHAVLTRFARSLPGFAHSSPEYLFQNFLAGTSSVLLAPGRLEVWLPRAPLTLVLQLARAYRPYALPWRQGEEIWLHAPLD